MRFNRWTHQYIRQVIGTITYEIQHLPLGYKFWSSLSNKRQQAITRHWVQLLYDQLFPQYVKDNLATLVLTQYGIPREDTAELYKWVVDVVYHGSEFDLYQRWLVVKKRVQHDDSE